MAEAVVCAIIFGALLVIIAIDLIRDHREVQRKRREMRQFLYRAPRT